MIYHPDRKRQILDFEGLSHPLYQKMRPTDIDCICEVRNSGWFLLEVKYAGKPVPENDGQRILMQNFAGQMLELGKPTMCVIADHYVDEPMEDVPVRDCLVRELLWTPAGLHWFRYAHTKTVGEVFRGFMAYIAGKKKEGVA